MKTFAGQPKYGDMIHNLVKDEHCSRCPTEAQCSKMSGEEQKHCREMLNQCKASGCKM